MSLQAVQTVVEILDKSLNKVAEIRTFYPLNGTGQIIRYSKELSDYGTCTFRMSAFDPILTTVGDIIQPHKYHVRLKRGNVVVWQGAIIANKKRTSEYIEVYAVQYIWYLDHLLVNRTSADAAGNTNIFRIFSTGTMDTAVTALINETISKISGVHILSGMTIGTVENPNYPPNTVDASFNNIGGQPWNFTSYWTLQFDFKSVLYVLKTFGIYAYADFEIDNNLKFNFKKQIGNNHKYGITFSYGSSGNILEYNLPRLGDRMANKLWGIATDGNGVIIQKDQSDEMSQKTYGLMEQVASFRDVINVNALDTRLAAELPLVGTPDETNVQLTLNEKAYPYGQFDVGDIVTVKIVNRSVNFLDTRRVVGITVDVHETGRETIVVQTNKPLAGQFGYMGSI
jgi:hypothetical protein